MNNALIVTKSQAKELIQKYGSPLYVYDEKILRKRCHELKHLIGYPHYAPCYSAKANSNTELLRIIHEEGFRADAMSPGEIFLDLNAGFNPEEITFYSNNVSQEEMLSAVRQNISVCLDSLDQLDAFGCAAPHHDAAIRINPGIGDGHHQKVITGGHTKFGISLTQLDEVDFIARKHDLHITGICSHIGSLFLDPSVYLKAAEILFRESKRFTELKFIDLGGGFGVPYHGEARLDLPAMGTALDQIIEDAHLSPIEIRTEPGRYLVAECGQLLGTVNAVKHYLDTEYIGTDIGFNVLMRPVLYDAWHEIVSYSDSNEKELVTVTGNICESGDILGKERYLAKTQRGDLIGILNAGAYGYSMASSYNGRLRPAEVLISDNQTRLIRRRETIADLLRLF